MPARRGRARRLTLASALVLAAQAVLAAADHPTVAVVAEGPGGAAAPLTARAYAEVFTAAGFPVRSIRPRAIAQAGEDLVVVPASVAAGLDIPARTALLGWLDRGGRLVTAGESELARALGVRFTGGRAPLEGISDGQDPQLEIHWRTPASLPAFDLPQGARVFFPAPDGRPVVAGFVHGRGRVLYLGLELDEESPLGYSRFPFFLEAVQQALEVAPLLAAPRLAAYCDVMDHRGADVEELARSWYGRGLREIHVGAWDAWNDSGGFYERLIAACHRHGLRVLAWLELPNVNTGFWDAHPEWRERTAAGTDAHVDWRRLMALDQPECWAAVAKDLAALIERLDWDGVDLAEVYFESPLGFESPARFTPFNDHARQVFRAEAGFDPLELFDPAGPHFWQRDPTAAERFLEFRRWNVVSLHDRLLGLLDEARRRKPHLDVVVTLVDALYDRTMRDRIGVDVPRIAALLPRHRARLQVEDPFTLWDLGPERYERIGRDYAPLAPPNLPLAVDINVVSRGGEVYPTARQTGLELLQLVARAHRRFPIVCVYSEASVPGRDWPWLRHALASTARVEERAPEKLRLSSPGGVEVAVETVGREIRLDGGLWPAVREGVVLVPPGRHEISWRRAAAPPGLRLLDLNGTLLDSSSNAGALTVRYDSFARAYLLVSFEPRMMRIDGRPAAVAALRGEGGFVIAAPPGEHTVTLTP